MRVRRCWGGQALWPSPRPTNPLGRQPWLAPGAIEPMTKGADKGVLEHEDSPPRAVYTNEYGGELLEGFKGQESQASPSPEQWAAWGLLAARPGGVSGTEKAPAPRPRPCVPPGQQDRNPLVYLLGDSERSSLTTVAWQRPGRAIEEARERRPHACPGSEARWGTLTSGRPCSWTSSQGKSPDRSASDEKSARPERQRRLAMLEVCPQGN